MELWAPFGYVYGIGTLVVAAGASLLDEGQRVRRFQGFDE